MSGWGGGNEWNGPAPSEQAVIARLRQSNEILRDELRTYHRKRFTGFVRGALVGAILASGAFIASAAMGETISIGRLHINGEAQGATTVSIAPSDEPGEWAVVTFTNEYVNDGGDTGSYTLTLEEVVIGIEFAWDQNPITGADQITVVVPFGLTCIPDDCIAIVPEGQVGTVIIYDFWGA